MNTSSALSSLSHLHLRSEEWRVLAFILSQMASADRVSLTYGQMARELDMTRPNVRRALLSLIARRVMTITDGAWTLRPSVAWLDLDKTSTIRSREVHEPKHVNADWEHRQPIYKLRLQYYGAAGI